MGLNGKLCVWGEGEGDEGVWSLLELFRRVDLASLVISGGSNPLQPRIDHTA